MHRAHSAFPKKKLAPCYITPAFSGVPKDMGDKITIGGAHKWAEMLHHPCNLGDPQQKQQSQRKKSKKNSHGVPSPACFYRLTPLGFEPRTLQLPRYCFTTRVWPISNIPLHRGGIHISSNLVFIHYWVILQKQSILSIDTWGGNPFFQPLLSPAKFPVGAFGNHSPALPGENLAGRRGWVGLGWVKA